MPDKCGLCGVHDGVENALLGGGELGNDCWDWEGVARGEARGGARGGQARGVTGVFGCVSGVDGAGPATSSSESTSPAMTSSSTREYSS